MRKGQFVTTLVVHACPRQLTAQLPALLKPISGTPCWSKQDLLDDHLGSEFKLSLSEEQLEELASEIYALGGVYFELNQSQGKRGLLFMGVPGLGVFRGELNEAGSVLLSEDRITQMLNTSAGNQREFLRLLRVSLGQSWDDIIEPFRAARFSDNVVLLNRAG
jgi:hypothetical protein